MVFAWSGHWRTQFCIAFVSFCMVLLLFWNCKPGFHTEFCMQQHVVWIIVLKNQVFPLSQHWHKVCIMMCVCFCTVIVLF